MQARPSLLIASFNFLHTLQRSTERHGRIACNIGLANITERRTSANNDGSHWNRFKVTVERMLGVHTICRDKSDEVFNEQRIPSTKHWCTSCRRRTLGEQFDSEHSPNRHPNMIQFQ